MGQVAATRRTPEDPGERAAAHLRERQKAVSVGPLFPGRGWRSEGAQGPGSISCVRGPTCLLTGPFIAFISEPTAPE